MAGLTPLFTDKQVRAWARKFEDRQVEKMLSLLIKVGEDALAYARENGRYIDHTGNLRSSTGYLVQYNGREVESVFEVASKGTDKNTGRIEGKKLAFQIGEQYPGGAVLILVAGMNYALSVESMENKDVLGGASVYADKLARDLINKLTDGI